MKVSWYTISAGGEQDASAKRLAAYLLEQYQEKVLAPVAVEIDPDAITAQATAFYAQLMAQQMPLIAQRHGVPIAQLNGRCRRSRPSPRARRRRGMLRCSKSSAPSR